MKTATVVCADFGVCRKVLTEESQVRVGKFIYCAECAERKK